MYQVSSVLSHNMCLVMSHSMCYVTTWDVSLRSVRVRVSSVKCHVPQYVSLVSLYCDVSLVSVGVGVMSVRRNVATHGHTSDCPQTHGATLPVVSTHPSRAPVTLHTDPQHHTRVLQYLHPCSSSISSQYSGALFLL